MNAIDLTLTDESCTADLMAAKLAALSHPARIRILHHLSGQGACCCKEVVEHLDLAQSTVSQHLKVLVDAGLVRFSPERQRSRYTVDRVAVARLSSAVSTYFNDVSANCCG